MAFLASSSPLNRHMACHSNRRTAIQMHRPLDSSQPMVSLSTVRRKEDTSRLSLPTLLKVLLV